jgi:hypothetical protein
MLYEKKYYGNGHGNFDDADFVLAPNEWVNLENCRVGSTDKGVVGTVESIGSNVLLSPLLPSVTFVQIGSVVDEENNRIIYFLKDLYGPWDKIICYDVASTIFYDVLLANQVTGGLNFDKNSIIHSARIVNSLLYWPDGTTNEPRKIDIDAGIKLNDPSFVTDAVAYVAPINFSEITIIKPPPPLAPIILKNTDTGFVNNFIANESFSFTYQYIYYNNEITVVGTYSNASRLNKVTDTFNRIIVTMNSLERIPQTVKIVNLIVRVGTTAFTIKTWDKSIASEAIEIANQNLGTAQLTYNFYNNITGPALSSDLILKPFDSVPVYSAALEIAKNRVLLGNNVEGYDTPTRSSLEFTLNTVSLTGTSVSVNLEEIELQRPFPFAPQQRYKAYYVYLDMVVPVGYYAVTSSESYCVCSSFPTLPAAPTTLTMAALTYRGVDVAAVLVSVNAAFAATLTLGQNYYSIYFVTVTGISVSTYDIFKTQTQYKIGVVFYDYALRKCGVVTRPFSPGSSDPTLVTIPPRNFALSTATNGINWTLDNVTNPAAEIPDWAYYYCVVRTLNLRTRYFLQALQHTSNAKYATKDADGNYVFTDSTFPATCVGIGLETTSLTQAGLGYVFTEGDVCYLIKEDNTKYTLSVIGQSGKYIIVNVPEGGIGDFTAFKMIYELYTPYQSSDQEPYYETGKLSAVVNPGLPSRYYSAPTGTFIPDAYALTRNFDTVTYFAETMSPNDRFFSRWDNDGGKVNFVVKSGQAIKPQNISYSNVYIPGTATNGLSTFEALNEKSVPLENGAIRKLILTSKTQDQGDVMLAICENETSSIYMGETRIVDSTGASQFFAASLDVISTINNLKGSFGTINPESVTEFRGNVYWVDVLNGKVVQYSLNGLFPISSYKMSRYWKLFCEQYLALTQQDIEALGSRPFIFTTVDPNHWELLITVPKVLATPPLGYLPDPPYTNYVYPFDIWDGQAKTLVYKINAEPNFWQGSYSYTQEGYITVQNTLYSFKYGMLYEHNNTDSYCNFNGVQYTSRIMGIGNQQPERPKVYDNMSVEANMLPTLTYLMCLEPYTQVSNLQDFDWSNKEGVLYSQIYRNVLTPSATGLLVNGLIKGEKMRTCAFRLMLEFTVSSFPVELRFVTLGYQLSLGHSIPIQ